jgi:hypothetical protein
MKHSSRVKATGLALSAALLAATVTLPAFASLGGNAASADADTVKMKAQSRATPAAGYTVTQITLTTGTVVNEYISALDKVFAVAWKGPMTPDLQQTLGTYFTAFTAATSVPHGAGHHGLTIQQPDFVMQTSGHMRAWRGKAYVPSLLPPNFSLDDIQ